MEYILPQTDSGIKDKIQNSMAGRSGLKELGGGIGNGPDQSLCLTAPPAVLYPGRGAIMLPPCSPQARCSTPLVKPNVPSFCPPQQVPPTIVAPVEVGVVHLPQRRPEICMTATPTNEYLHSGFILGLYHSSNRWLSFSWTHLGALPLLQPMSIFIVASSWGSATPPTNEYLYSGLILGLCHSSKQ